MTKLYRITGSSLLGSLLILFFFSCGQTPPGNSNASGMEIPTPTVSPDNGALLTQTDTITLRLNNGSGAVSFNKIPDRTNYVRFDITVPSTIHAEIAAGPQANIRFDRIILPDGTTDGPFGQTVDYSIPGPGTCFLLLHENMMAGDPWGGPVTVQVSVRVDR